MRPNNRFLGIENNILLDFSPRVAEYFSLLLSCNSEKYDSLFQLVVFPVTTWILWPNYNMTYSQPAFIRPPVNRHTRLPSSKFQLQNDTVGTLYTGLLKKTDHLKFVFFIVSTAFSRNRTLTSYTSFESSYFKLLNGVQCVSIGCQMKWPEVKNENFQLLQSVIVHHEIFCEYYCVWCHMKENFLGFQMTYRMSKLDNIQAFFSCIHFPANMTSMNEGVACQFCLSRLRSLYWGTR